MKVSKTIRKIVALGVGATMMGATILGATAAADLKNYPSFFVEDGTFNGAIVVRGEEDSLAAVDIAANMKSKVAGASTSGTVSVSGDVKQIKESGDRLELYEQLGEVSPVLTGDDLKGLASYKVSTDKGSTDVNQYLRFDQANLSNTSDVTGAVIYDESDDDTVGDFLFFKDGDDLFEYEIEFTDGLESDVVAAKLDDLEDKKLTLLGKEFVVVDTAADVVSDDTVTIQLMGGAVRDNLNLDESKSFDIAGVSYDVALTFVDANECKFTINGETTDLLEDGETDKLSDGTQIGVSEVLYQDYAGGKQQCEFFLGADELELTDNNFADDAYDESGVTANDEGIEDGKVKIRASSANSNGTVEITKISYILKADGKGGDDPWIPAGKGVRDFLDEPQGMMHSNWDVSYKGFAPVDDDVVKFSLNGDDQYNIEFTNVGGKSYKVPYVNTEAAFKFGDDDDDLWFYEFNATASGESFNQTEAALNLTRYSISEDDYFILSDADITVADENTFSYILRYDSVDKADNKVTFSDLSGVSYEVTYATASTSTLQSLLAWGAHSNFGQGDEIQSGDLIVGGKVYKFLLSEDNGTNLSVDLNHDGVLKGITLNNSATADTFGEVGLVSKNGMRIDLASVPEVTRNATNKLVGGGSGAAGRFNATLFVESDQLDESTVDEQTAVNIFESSATELDLDVPNANVSNLDEDAGMDNDDAKDEDRGITRYGLWLAQTEESGGTTNSELTIKVPKSQREPLVYVELGATETSTSDAGGSLARVTVPVTATLLPSEVTNVAAQNLITIGGPCANSVTAQVMYTKQGKTAPADCTSGFNPGEAVVAVYDVDGKVAMVVAGYSGADTRRAGKVLADSGKYSLSGSQVTVTGTTFKDIAVSKVK